MEQLKLAYNSPIMGAEAIIKIVDWHGRKAIQKLRIPKNYRNTKLDKYLRERRTREEAFILHNAKLADVNCPEVYFADPLNSEIIMEFIKGSHLKDFKCSGKNDSLLKLYGVLGSSAAKLHSSKIIHGDLTTKNVLVSGDNRLALIDFGLSFYSERIEDMAEDLHLLKQAIRTQVKGRLPKVIFDAVIQGYQEERGAYISRRVIYQMAGIERRGRYARID